MTLITRLKDKWKLSRSELYKRQVKELEDAGFYEKFLSKLEVPLKGKRVLEVGPGFGSWMRAIRTFDPASLIGVDVSEFYAEKLRKEGFVIRNADACNLPFETGSFDFVLCYLVIPFVKDEELALNELMRVTSEGGVVFVALHGIGFYIRRLVRGKLYSIYPILIGTLRLIVGRKLGASFQVPSHVINQLVKGDFEVLRAHVPTVLGTPAVFTVLAKKLPQKR